LTLRLKVKSSVMNSPTQSTTETDSNVVRLEDITVEFFKPLVNKPFSLEWGGEQPEQVELVTLTEAPARHGVPGGRVPFSLIFRAGSREFYVPQGIYPLVQSQAGRIDLFLVPIGPDAAGMQFQAVFN
jgi:hypothetical protein